MTYEAGRGGEGDIRGRGSVLRRESMEKCSVMTTDGSIMPAWLGGTGWGKVGGGRGRKDVNVGET